MRIGLLPVYATRPNPQFSAYMAGLLRVLGHETETLACDGAIGTCTNHVFRAHSKLLECACCCLGGVRSYNIGPVASMRPVTRGAISASTAFDLAYSTAITTSRVENPSDFTSSRVRNLQEALPPGIEYRGRSGGTLDFTAED